MKERISLCALSPDECAVVRELRGNVGMKRRFYDLGLTPDTRVKCVGKSPSGDPCAYLVRGAVIAIRAEDCRDIWVERIGGEQWD